MSMVAQPTLWEQRKRGSVADRYARWRAAHGQLFAQIEQRVLACSARGDQRIEINRIVADLRHEGAGKIRLDNSLRAPLSAELVRRHPFLTDKIKRKPRRSL